MDALDFDDLLMERPNVPRAPVCARKVPEEFQHILVDEYQDTNGVQYELDPSSGEGPQRDRVVGDYDRDFLRFPRGADIRTSLI